MESICRICLDNDPKYMIQPCKCDGTMKYVHSTCLKQWCYKSNNYKNVEHVSQLMYLQNHKKSHRENKKEMK